MDKLLRKANIWDLHIHTPLGTPTKKNYGNVSNEEFIDAIIDIYNKSNNKIGMISFTDHNLINVEAYELFREKSEIAIIPGIEVDIFLSENDANSKHIIFYFEEDELKCLNELKELIETFIKNHSKVFFEDFVMHLTSNNRRFVISPHAFKQGKRGIDYDWFDEKKASRGTREFTGLFFPFWEAAGKTDICKAIDFLNSQYNDKNCVQAIIAFSDSADYKKIQDYIEKPHQYFLCLNSFKGLLLAGSDPDRIIYDVEERPKSNPSEKIKEIKLSNNLKPIRKNNTIELEFSDRLNVIVGGRGKGKSALLDAIVASLNDSEIQDSSRREFVRKFHVEIKNFNDVKMPSDLNFLYFSQSYINKLFDGDSQYRLEKFFEKEFAHNEKITEGTADLQAIMEESVKGDVIEDVNINDEFLNLVILNSETVYLQIKKSKEKAEIPLICDEESYYKVIKNKLPNDKEVWDEDLEQCLKSFIDLLIEKICVANYKNRIEPKFSIIMQKKNDEIKKRKSKESQKKIESKKKIEQKLRFLYIKELERIRQINKLYEIDEKKTHIKIQHYKTYGEDDNRFYFVTVVNKEHPVEYAKRIIIEAVNKVKIKRFEKSSNKEVFMKYATTQELVNKLKESENFSSIVEKIDGLKELRSAKVQKIIYIHDGEYIDLHKTSPGTQTNAVMEYILHSDSTTPLFIDQPEDNIDNEARYAQLTKWIRKQKYNRQIVIVTHDANIVINGDAENVIIANHSVDSFAYEYGALEYGDILDKAAIILDGGKTAIHRRIEKYGE